MDHRKIQIIFATGNKGKIREIKEILARRPGIEVLSMREAGVEASPEENGADFEDNALIKAQAVYDLLQARPASSDTYRIVMSDDSGLEIDALGGAPPVTWGMIPITGSAWSIFSPSWRASRMNSGPPALSPPWQPSSPTVPATLSGAPWKAGSGTRSPGRTASVMIPSSTCPNTA